MFDRHEIYWKIIEFTSDFNERIYNWLQLIYYIREKFTAATTFTGLERKTISHSLFPLTTKLNGNIY